MLACWFWDGLVAVEGLLGPAADPAVVLMGCTQNVTMPS
jgi:hypothetical protein